MKRNVLRRSLSLVLALLVTLGMTSTVFAAEAMKGDIIFFTDDEVYVGYMCYAGAYDDETGDELTITSMTSSDPSIGKVVKKDGYYNVKGVAAGKVTITANISYKGKTETLSVPVKVMKVPKVFKSLKVCGKKINLAKHPFGLNKKVTKAKTVKIKAPAASSWKIKSVSAYAYKSAKDAKGTKVKVTKSMLKNGKKIKFGKKYKNMIVFVMLVNKKTGDSFGYSIQFYRKTPFAK